MKKINMVMEDIHEHENDLRAALLRISERHKADHEIYHVGRDLADWSATHVRKLAEIGRDYGLELDPEPKDETKLGKLVREKGGEAVGRRSEAGLLLLRDLRKIYLQAAGLSSDWELLGQAAQGTKDKNLLNLTKECHPGTLRQMRWANAMLKTVSPQILAG